MHPAKTMVIDCPSANPLPIRTDWYPGATWVHGLPTEQDFRVWLQDLDVVYTAETGYGQALWNEAERQGVKTVLHANYEFLDYSDRPTLWAAPSMWHYEQFPDPKCFLPVPVTRFGRSTGGTNFLHVVGRPAIHDRNGTTDLLNALQYVDSPITVTLTCQDPNYVQLAQYRFPDHVTVRQLTGDVTNHWDLYRNQDVLVMPRRFGGLCLPVNEALGFGMPTIMPNISPNNTWLPSEWLTPADVRTTFRAKQHVDVYQSDVRALAAKIDQFAQPTFHEQARTKAVTLAEGLSWDALRPVYKKTFEVM